MTLDALTCMSGSAVSGNAARDTQTFRDRRTQGRFEKAAGASCLDGQNLLS
jgi:hypothetical protein